MAKSEDNHKAQFPKSSVSVGQNLIFIIITFRMLKMAFILEFARNLREKQKRETKKPSLLASVKVKKI